MYPGCLLYTSLNDVKVDPTAATDVTDLSNLSTEAKNTFSGFTLYQAEDIVLDADQDVYKRQTLASSRNRGKVFMGHDASMEVSNILAITVDQNSTRYADKIKDCLLYTSLPDP